MFFIFVFFLSAVSLSAEIGVKAGGLFSFAGQDSAVYNASNRIGPRGGFFWSLGIGPLSVRTGIDLARKGSRYYSATTRATMNLDLDYIVVPILLNIHVVGTPIDVFAGPYGGLLIRSTKRDLTHDWTWEGNSVDKFDYGVEAGIRYRFFKFLFCELHFDYGMADVVFSPDDPEGRVHKNRTLSLLFGLRL